MHNVWALLGSETAVCVRFWRFQPKIEVRNDPGFILVKFFGGEKLFWMPATRFHPGHHPGRLLRPDDPDDLRQIIRIIPVPLPLCILNFACRKQ